MQTRLSRNVEKKTKRNLIIKVIATCLILFALVKFGVPVLINLSVFLAGTKNNSSSSQATTNDFIPTPIFNPSFTATNSATITLSGSAGPQQTIKLYVNNSLTDSVSTKDDGSFLFQNVTLSLGDNTIKAQAQKGTSESDFSDPLTVSYITVAPSLSVDSPSDNQTFSGNQSTITISGKTDQNVKVTINDVWAMEDDKGNFSYSLHLQNGGNQIRVDAIDDAGNKTEKIINVTYSQ